MQYKLKWINFSKVKQLELQFRKYFSNKHVINVYNSKQRWNLHSFELNTFQQLKTDFQFVF
jgi:hypothetical protein